MATEPNTNVDPKELEVARSTWHGFTQLVVYSSIGVAAILLFLRFVIY